ncbi:polysaccharide biosynthesis protein [Halorhodospira abdelmalekii]|uniref:polysaccharide biosynthesis protein n=1 Tax=Halorhodospira abdelmalekii TaxID=421629 RepID=UPI001904EA86|nr:nucleoside-diphosphate sugar epimerase/dehydratase [Halorhodospira abdelmalekii]MBK1733882.1 polysaccharide biosynthesis protein [Halorhodospira abdelmalekii]
MLGADALMLPVALWAAFALSLSTPTPEVLPAYAWLFVVIPLCALPIFAVFGLYRVVVRYMGPEAVMAVLKGVTVAALLFAVVATLGRLDGVPHATFLIFWLVALLMVGGSRFIVRAWFQSVAKRKEDKKPVAIYGAGPDGIQLASSLDSGLEYQPVAFVDDNPAKQGTVISGLPVESPQQLPGLIKRHKVMHVLLAMPRLSRARRREIVGRLEPLRAHILTVPNPNDLLSKRARLDQVREVEIEDLLGRDSVVPRVDLLATCITGKAVMVTGAGGSIGSELCRQILRLRPQRLVLLERSEYALYNIERELRSQIAGFSDWVELQAVLGDVADGVRMEALMRGFGVDTVYHAAAYKHVPMVEGNSVEGVRNNVFGTLNLASAAAQVGVRHFVLISTDKAVRPSNVMGATKRLAELILQALARQPDIRTRFSMVRFGNVLDSSGSVVPLFREQIKQGGPVTVTHPEVTRYFMTISEAASLVIQAGSMAEGGEVFVLDMGEPVRVLDLAKRLIRLSGFEERTQENPQGDIEIRFIGLRPGEKLYEELLLGRKVMGTEHPMIMRAQEAYLPWSALCELLQTLRDACDRFDGRRVRSALAAAVEGYEVIRPVEGLLVWDWVQHTGSETPAERVAEVAAEFAATENETAAERFCVGIDFSTDYAERYRDVRA